ncbi:hypothetical protein [Halalkalicoccus subterraneus]|uniref:hypothetical protein n=1 Tax=Halalkalicoccus subterraneus TaxID=2675002 RepID=UPI001FEA6D92|nr:hypothetical protein [Halalkalicoccus subterraneus]
MSAVGAAGIAGLTASVRAQEAKSLTNAERILESLEGHQIGGGVGHRADISLEDADVTVESTGAFFDALDSSADVIGVPGTAQIDLSGRDFTLSGQMIVSDRGIDGSPGALLYTTDHGADSPAWDGGSSGRGLITMRGGSRISGVRLRGPYHDYYDDPAYPGYIPLDDADSYQKREEMRQERYARGIRIVNDDVEVDNCELYGWPIQAISIGSASIAVSPHIHHIYGHDCMMVGAGYVIDVLNGHPTIEMSYFNATRHSIIGFGHPTCGYTLKDSVFGPITYSHAVDMHSLAENGYGDDLTAGGRVEVRRCTFAFTHTITDNPTQAIAFRGYPDDKYITENNRFLHDVDSDFENPVNTSGQSVPYRQVNVGSGWHDWQSSDNQYGLGEPHEPGVGAPVNLNDR